VFIVFTLGMIGRWTTNQQASYFITVLRGVATSGGMAAFMIALATLGAMPIARRLAGPQRISLLLPTAAALGIGLEGLLVLGLGLCGWIGFGTCLAVFMAPACIGAVDLILARRRRTILTESAPAAPAAPWAWLWLAAAPFLAISVCGASIMPGELWVPGDPHPYDVLTYHLQIPRQWFDAGRIQPLNENVFSYFPAQAEVLDLAAMELMHGPYNAMYVTQFLSLLEAGLMVWMVYGGIGTLARARGAPPDRADAAATVAAVAAAAIPWVAMLASVAYVESLMLLEVAGATLWAALATRERSISLQRSLLAGALAGLACGTKYTAVPMTLVPLAMALAGATLIRRHSAEIDWPRLIATPLALMLCGLFVFSPWLIRNAAWNGNPVYPLAMRQLGRGDFSPAQVERFVIAHSPPPAESSVAGRGIALVHEVLATWQFGYLLIPAGIVAAVCIAGSGEGLVLAISLAGVWVVWIGFTHLIGRFFVSGIPIAAMAIGLWCAGPGNGRYRLVSGKARLWVGGTGAIVSALLGLGQPWPYPMASHAAEPPGPLAGLIARFRPLAETAGNGLYFLYDVTAVAPPELLAIQSTDAGLAMIGASQAFLQPLRSDRLLYRTVFDVNIPSDQNLIDGWLGRSVQDLRSHGYWVLIRDSELKRLSSTYARLPAFVPSQPGEPPVRILPPLQSVKLNGPATP
jgi:hypothetical protein